MPRSHSKWGHGDPEAADHHCYRKGIKDLRHSPGHPHPDPGPDMDEEKGEGKREGKRVRYPLFSFMTFSL